MASIRKRGETFTLTVSMGYQFNPKTGKNEQVKKTKTWIPPAGMAPKKAENEAQKAADLWESRIKGYTNLNENAKFEEIVEWYLETVAPAELRESTIDGHRMAFNAFILPKLGYMKLRNITPTILDGFLNEMQSNGRVKRYFTLKNRAALDGIRKELPLRMDTICNLRNGGRCMLKTAEMIADYMQVSISDIFAETSEKRLSKKMVERLRQQLSAVFAAAVKKELIERNPVSKTNAIIQQTNHHQEAKAILTEEQALALRSALNDFDLQFKTMITLTLFSGCRGGEICGLPWDNVDFEHSMIYINQTLCYIRKKGYKLQPPKTKNSIRHITNLPKPVMDLLREHKENQENWQSGFNGMCFTSPQTGYYSEKSLNKKFKRLAHKLGFSEDITLHSLRHTTASILIDNPENSTKAVSEFLGHSKTSMTEDVYARVFAKRRAALMKGLEMKLTP